MDPRAAEPLFLTCGLPGIGGVLRRRHDDFAVEELPLREPSGRGSWLRVFVEKRGMATPELLRRLGAALERPARQLGVAGYKDAAAVTRQWVSIPGALAPRLSRVRIRDVSLLRVARDTEPLRIGDLAGNRFRIVVRDVDPPAAAPRVRAVLDVLGRRGVPHFFGPQRFGVRGTSAAIGGLLLRRDFVGALDLLLGAPSDAEADPRARAFREAYEAGRWFEARRLVPGALRLEMRLLDQLARGESKAAVARRVPAPERRFFLSAWQSLSFNRVLARRLPAIDRVLEGDLLLDTGGDTAYARGSDAEQAGVDRHELHPSGPLFGSRVRLARGAPGEIEREVLDAEELDPHLLERPAGLPLKGERRALRVFARDVEVESIPGDAALRLSFTLPSGAFATALLAEVMKDVEPVT